MSNVTNRETLFFRLKALPRNLILAILAMVGAVCLGTQIPGLGSAQAYFLLFAIPALAVAGLIYRRFGSTGLLFIYCALIWWPFTHAWPIPGLYGARDVEVVMFAGAALVITRSLLSGLGDHRRLRSFRFDPLWILLFMFVIGGLVAFSMRQVPDRNAAYYLMRWISWLSVAAYLVTRASVKTPGEAERILWGVLVGGSILAILTLFTRQSAISPQVDVIDTFYLYGFWTVPFFLGSSIRVSSPGLASYLSNIMPAALIISLFHSQKVVRRFGRMVLFLFVISLLALESRNGLVSAAVSTLMVLWLAHKVGLRARPSILAQSFSLLLVLAVLIAASFIDVSVFSERMHTFTDLGISAGVTGRVEIWKRGLDVVATHPLGIGFTYLLPLYDLPKNSHSLYIGLAFGTGILGLLAFAGFVVFCVKRCLDGLRLVDDTCKRVCLAAIGSFVAVAVNGIGNDVHLLFWDFLSMWIIAGAALAAIKAASPGSKTGYV